MVYIYTLLLTRGKYYVGKTLNPNFRIESHFNSEGSEWTKIYKPKKILEIIEGDDYDEDKYTKIYMDKYGIDNVRGGSYTSIILDKETKNHLVKNSNSTNDRCFKCGKEGHFANNCRSYKSLSSSKTYNRSLSSSKTYSGSLSSSKKCDICGKYGHYEVNCDHQEYFPNNCPKTKCYVCGKKDHIKEECKSIYWHCSKCYKEFDTKTSCINHEHKCCNDVCEKQNINKSVDACNILDNLLTTSPSIIRQNIKNLEIIDKLKFYKIKIGDIILNYDVHHYNSLQEIINDTNKIMNYTDKDLIKNPNINSDSAKTIYAKYLKLIRTGVYDNISQLLGLLTEEICHSLQNGISFQKIEKNIQSNALLLT
jgi:cellular nucleic acid-binding protein